MDFKHELTIFVNDTNLVQKELQLDGEKSALNEIFICMENYYEQIHSIKTVETVLINNNRKQISSIYTNVDNAELKQKLLFKLNKLVNEKVESIKSIL